MSCPACALDNQKEFSAEMVVHLGGLRNIDRPGVWIFQNLLVCLDCGFAQFMVPKSELALLAATHTDALREVNYGI
jgi:hypothetical protein